MSETVYLNGIFTERAKAQLSPDDRGFIFSDGVYEVIKYYNGRPFRYSDHIDRLKRSLKEISVSFNDFHILDSVFEKLLEENNLKKVQAGVYLQITRGVNNRVHHFPPDLTPTVYAFAFPFASVVKNLEEGIKVITREDIRWLRCDIKSVSLLANTMLYNQAVNEKAGECILIRNGKVTEASHSSVVAVKNDTVITHPLSNLILPGITRKVILEICARNKIPVDERPLLKEELYDADELIIAGTGSEITPVVQVDDVVIGNKKPGMITRFLQDKYFEMV